MSSEGSSKIFLQWLLNGNLSKEKYTITNDDMSKKIETNIYKEINVEDIQTSVHMYPHQSIGYLHIMDGYQILLQQDMIFTDTKIQIFEMLLNILRMKRMIHILKIYMIHTFLIR